MRAFHTGWKVRKSNEITPGDIGFVNLSAILQKSTKCWCHKFKKTAGRNHSETPVYMLTLHITPVENKYCTRKPFFFLFSIII